MLTSGQQGKVNHEHYFAQANPPRQQHTTIADPWAYNLTCLLSMFGHQSLIVMTLLSPKTREPCFLTKLLNGLQCACAALYILASLVHYAHLSECPHNDPLEKATQSIHE